MQCNQLEIKKIISIILLQQVEEDVVEVVRREGVRLVWRDVVVHGKVVPLEDEEGVDCKVIQCNFFFFRFILNFPY